MFVLRSIIRGLYHMELHFIQGFLDDLGLGDMELVLELVEVEVLAAAV